jgi:hypothetical protein
MNCSWAWVCRPQGKSRKVLGVTTDVLRIRKNKFTHSNIHGGANKCAYLNKRVTNGPPLTNVHTISEYIQVGKDIFRPQMPSQVQHIKPHKWTHRQWRSMRAPSIRQSSVCHSLCQQQAPPRMFTQAWSRSSHPHGPHFIGYQPWPLPRAVDWKIRRGRRPELCTYFVPTVGTWGYDGCPPKLVFSASITHLCHFVTLLRNEKVSEFDGKVWKLITVISTNNWESSSPRLNSGESSSLPRACVAGDGVAAVHLTFHSYQHHHHIPPNSPTRRSTMRTRFRAPTLAIKKFMTTWEICVTIYISTCAFWCASQQMTMPLDMRGSRRVFSRYCELCGPGWRRSSHQVCRFRHRVCITADFPAPLTMWYSSTWRMFRYGYLDEPWDRKVL